MEHILSLSYGKDSMACLGAIKELGWPLDRIVTFDIWATDTIPADFPVMIEFKERADQRILEEWGIKVEHFQCDTIYTSSPGCNTFEKGFYYKVEKGKFAGNVKGWPMLIHPWCKKLKTFAAKKLPKDSIQYLGIAIDEPKRFGDLNLKHLSPLVEAKWTEEDCRNWCEKKGLLSPIYETASRGGCWFCPYQGVDQLRKLRNGFPEYWDLMLKWDEDSPVIFKAEQHTLADYEKRFKMEDEGLIVPGKRFFWKNLQ